VPDLRTRLSVPDSAAGIGRIPQIPDGSPQMRAAVAYVRAALPTTPSARPRIANPIRSQRPTMAQNARG